MAGGIGEKDGIQNIGPISFYVESKISKLKIKW